MVPPPIADIEELRKHCSAELQARIERPVICASNIVVVQDPTAPQMKEE